MNCREVQELAAPDLLGLLDPDELVELDRHLESCHACMTSLMDDPGPMSTAPPLSPPPRVKRGLMDRVEADSAHSTRPFPRLVAVLGVKPSLQPILALSAVLVVALALAASWAGGRPSDVPVSAVAASQVDAGEGEDQLFLAYSAAAPGLAVEELSATRAADTARGMFLAPQSSNSALLAGIGMPQIPKGMTYCVWFITYGQRYKAGTFQVDSTGYGYVNIRLFVPLSWIEAISVTIEEEDGADGDPADLPLGPTVLRGDF